MLPRLSVLAVLLEFTAIAGFGQQPQRPQLPPITRADD